MEFEISSVPYAVACIRRHVDVSVCNHNLDHVADNSNDPMGVLTVNEKCLVVAIVPAKMVLKS